MSKEALEYQLNTYLGGLDRLLVHYDFSYSDIAAYQSGSSYQAYITNSFPSQNTGNYDGKIIGATGTSGANALAAATGVGAFMDNGTGDLRKNSIQVSGAQNLNLNDCSYIAMIDSELRDDGVLFGSFEKESITVNGQEIVSSKGFNWGMNDRGKQFVQSLNQNGAYCIVANQDELSKKNVIGLTFGGGLINIYRFDYLNESIYEKSVPASSENILNCENLFIGSSPSYWRGDSGDLLFSGSVENIAIISGAIPRNSLYQVGKSFISEYTYNSGAVTTGSVLSGYNTTIIYRTGVTGAIANITGNLSVQSGVPEYYQNVSYTGDLTVKEGDRYYESFGDYFEEKGFLFDTYRNTYAPTGDGASGTLGLQTGNSTVSGYDISGAFSGSSYNLPLYEVEYLYGVTNEVSGVVNTPVYLQTLVTGDATSGIQIVDDVSNFQKNYIYYLGARI
ncbi:hypothetical protein N9955_00850 [bacterium]|nr:hypothetical protein [bacterium]